MKNTADKPGSAPTITGIARRAGVSHATVSLVLNERGSEVRINPETAKRIRRIADEMKYVPNHLARGLRGKATMTVGVLWSLGGPHPSEGLTRRLTMLARQRGYSASVADTLSESPIIQAALTDFIRRGVDGVIIQLGSTALLKDQQIIRLLERFKAAVVVSRLDAALPCDHVVQESAGALGEAVGHLVRSGRRRLAAIGEAASSRSRLLDIQRAMAAAGLDPAGLRWLDFSFNVGKTAPGEVHQALDDQCRAGVDFDGLLCGCDELAAGCIAWLRGKDLCVPRDVAVIGFNDSHLSAFFEPAIASVARCDDGVAQTAIELLFDRLAQPGQPARRQVVSMRFVPRDSAGARADDPERRKD